MSRLPDGTSIPPAYAGTLLTSVRHPDFLRATLAGIQRGARLDCDRVTIRAVELRDGRQLQISCFNGRQDVCENIRPDDAVNALADHLAAGFANVHIDLREESIELRLSKKGQLLTSRHKRESPPPTDLSHNRSKTRQLPESGDPLLRALGMLDRAGNVRPTMRDKYTQINEFLKLLDHALPDAFPEIERANLERPIEILDCGCGSSHLTLATAHFLQTVKKIPARLTGIDINDAVLAKARERAATLPYHATFRHAAIGSLADQPADIVLALHACDTATDDALAQAVRSNARLILAVPCCHKDLNARIRIDALAPIHHHGILHQRQADLITDAFRALLLKVMGYRAEVIEFISPEHTARNLMIRAIKTRTAPDQNAMEEYQAFKNFTGVTPYLERALNSESIFQ